MGDHDDGLGRGFDVKSRRNERSYLELFQECQEVSKQVPEPLGTIDTGCKYMSQKVDVYNQKHYEARIVLVMEDMIYDSLYSIKEQLSKQGKTFSRRQIVQIWDETIHSKLVENANFGWSELNLQNMLWDNKTAQVIKDVTKAPPHI